MDDTWSGVLTVAAVVTVLAVAHAPLGDYLAKTYRSTRDLRVERLIYRLARVDPPAGQTWRAYAMSVLGFSAASLVVLYLLQRLQSVAPWSDGKPAVPPTMAFNTAVSFVTNTDWQSYSPEATVSNLTQMLGLAVQNFLSAAVGMAVAVALIRGIAARRGGDLGNFWVDLVRGTLRILLPLAFVIAAILVTAGAVQSWRTGVDVTMLDGSRAHVPVGPFASQEAIKVLGTNGGGTYAANSAHPFSVPTPLANLVEIIAVLLIPVSLTRTYGTMVGDRRQGYTLLGVMATVWLAVTVAVWAFEAHASGVAGATMEGKETRFGVPGSSLFAVATTGTSTGAVNSAHDSFSAAGGGGLIWNMLLGEVAPGGVGSGLYGLLVLAMVTVFVGGLLVGRSPEFLGKRIGRHEITLAALYVLVMPALVLTGVSISALLGSTRDSLGNDGAPGSPNAIHGFSEILYAYASAANNNGSAFGGLTVTDDWFQMSLGLAMLLGRLLPIVLVLALAGRLATQTPRDSSAETRGSALPTHGVVYGALLLGTTLLVAGLTFFPAMALGPIAEALA
ncbi:potassium-transporting ATPase subunit KdpA [Gordonia humi]|uniref:potassium-transporting ATPase subunit KdpA n=1 Tax=Gordonia humi TaxID=686429 RepID=UPI00361EFD19